MAKKKVKDETQQESVQTEAMAKSGKKTGKGDISIMATLYSGISF